MDPVSIAASSIASISTRRKLAAGLKFLRALSKAPWPIFRTTSRMCYGPSAWLLANGRIEIMCLEIFFSKVGSNHPWALRCVWEVLKNDSELAEQSKSHLLARSKCDAGGRSCGRDSRIAEKHFVWTLLTQWLLWVCEPVSIDTLPADHQHSTFCHGHALNSSLAPTNTPTIDSVTNQSRYIAIGIELDKSSK